MNYIDEKITTWNRLHFSDSVDMPNIVKLIKEGRQNDIYDHGFDYCEPLANSDGTLDPEENGGCSTLEVYKDNEIIWENSIEGGRTWMYPKLTDIEKELKILIDEGDNTEYTRGALEIIANFIKLEEDMCLGDLVIDLATRLGIPQQNIDKLY